MSSRRTVRVAEDFFEQLDERLGPERGPSGQPSATDFLVMELPAVVERFATDFDGLPEIFSGIPQGRVLVASGVLVHGIAVYGILRADDSIDLIGLELDLA